MDHHILTLENGLRVVFNPTRSVITHACMVVNVGTRDEPSGEFGIAHFIEHLLFKRTKRRNTNQILNRLELVGADLNAYTTKEYTCIHASFLHTHLTRAIDLFEDILFNSTFPSDEIEKEKNVILDEISSYQDSPEEAIADDFEDMIFSESGLGHNILGTEKDLASLNKTKIAVFVEKYYQPENMVLGITGDYTVNQVKRIVDRYFGNRKSKSVTHIRTPPSEPLSQKVTLTRPVNQAHYMLGTSAYPISHEKKMPLMVLNNFLGGMGMSSRLNLLVREKHGIAYIIESNYTAYSDTGIFSIYFGTEHEKGRKALALVHGELKKTRNKKMGSVLLKQAKNKFIGQIALGEENRMSLIIAMTKNLMDLGYVQTLDELYNQIEAVTAENIWEVANDIFAPDRINTLVFEPSFDKI